MSASGLPVRAILTSACNSRATPVQGPGVTLDQLDEPGRARETVAARRDHRTLGPGFDLLDPGLATGAFDRDDFEQIFDLGATGQSGEMPLQSSSVDLQLIASMRPRRNDRGNRIAALWRAGRDQASMRRLR